MQHGEVLTYGSAIGSPLRKGTLLGGPVVSSRLKLVPQMGRTWSGLPNRFLKTHTLALNKFLPSSGRRSSKVTPCMWGSSGNSSMAALVRPYSLRRLASTSSSVLLSQSNSAAAGLVAACGSSVCAEPTVSFGMELVCTEAAVA